MNRLKKSNGYCSNRKQIYLMISGVIISIASIVLAVLGAVFFLSDYMEKNSSESVPKSGTEISMEDTTDFETCVKITNLDEFAVPLLDEKAMFLEAGLSEYAEERGLTPAESTIIHVMIPEENVSQLYFFCRLSSEKIVLLVFDRQSETVRAVDCDYSEEEIVNEVWEGNAPSDRDFQE